MRTVRKIASVLLIISLMCVFVFTGCGAKADYSSPIAAAEAYNNGESIIGKTMKVNANIDCMAGVIYREPSTSLGANVGVILVDSNGSLTEKYDGTIHSGESVVVTIVSYDDHLGTSINITARPVE